MLKKLFLILALVIMAGVFVGSFALAQSPDILVDLPSWGQSLLTFAGALTILTQFIKQRLKKRLEHVPNAVIQGVTVALGIAIAAAIYTQGLLIDPMFAELPNPWGWLIYGTLGGVGSAGFYDLLTAFVTMRGGKPVHIDPNALPQNPEDLLEIVKTSSLSMDVRNRALDTLKGLNPLAGMAAEAFLNEFATRPLTENETAVTVDAEIGKRTGAQVVKGG